MKKDIILAGVGGQGILSIAAVIGTAALRENLYIKQAEVHGMSQRGGDVQSNLRLSSTPIHSDLIPVGGVDLIVSLEPMEALRYLPCLAKDGWIITGTTPLVNIPDYPAQEALDQVLDQVAHVIRIDVDTIAKELLSPRSANMVLLGATAGLIEILGPEHLREGIRQIFSRKGDAVVETNIRAFDAGYEYALKNR